MNDVYIFNVSMIDISTLDEQYYEVDYAVIDLDLVNHAEIEDILVENMYMKEHGLIRCLFNNMYMNHIEDINILISDISVSNVFMQGMKSLVSVTNIIAIPLIDIRNMRISDFISIGGGILSLEMSEFSSNIAITQDANVTVEQSIELVLPQRFIHIENIIFVDSQLAGTLCKTHRVYNTVFDGLRVVNSHTDYFPSI